MARDKMDNSIIDNEEMLVNYLSDGSKPKEEWRLGTEHEKFAYDRTTYKLLPYTGEKSIEILLQMAQKNLGWEPILDQGRIIGLVHPQEKGAISIEPGGQFELSGAAVKTVHETYQELQHHFAVMYDIATPLNIEFLAFGAHPVAKRDEVPRMPKSRYELMANYMPKVGNFGLDMMYRTATVQVNIDYGSEADMRLKMQNAMKIQPVITALFALSPFTHGRPNGLLSWRAQIWQDTDRQRTGILPFVFNENFGFSDYVNWALDIPMYFILRDGCYHDATHVTFRQFLQKQNLGDIEDFFPPTMGDWINHLSTLFPEVRLKQFLEMRGADGGPAALICALPALFAGAFYEASALNAVSALTKDWTYLDVQEMHEAVPKEGLNYQIKGINLWDIAERILEIAEEGLKLRKSYNNLQQDESIYLEPLWKIIKNRKTGAEQALERYFNAWQEDIHKLFSEYSYHSLR